MLEFPPDLEILRLEKLINPLGKMASLNEMESPLRPVYHVCTIMLKGIHFCWKPIVLMLQLLANNKMRKVPPQKVLYMIYRGMETSFYLQL